MILARRILLIQVVGYSAGYYVVLREMPRSGNSKEKDKEKFPKEDSHGKEKQKEKISRKSERVDISRAGPSSGRRASDADRAERWVFFTAFCSSFHSSFLWETIAPMSVPTF